jgi:magnesium transporter
MIRRVDLGDNGETEVDPKSIPTLDMQNSWIMMVDPTEKEIEEVAEKIGLSKIFLELPKSGTLVNLRLEQDLTVINFVMSQDVAGSGVAEPIVIVFSRTYLITIMRGAGRDLLMLVKTRMSKTKVDPPAQVAYFVVDEIVSSHFAQLEKLEELSSGIEEEVVEKTSSDTLKKIFNLKSKLINFNKTLWYERGLIFNLKTCGDACMPVKARSLFDTTHEDLTRQIDIVETYREIMSDAINVHLSAVSNKINLSIQSLTVVIFYLTIITTVTAFPNTVATFFGISRFGTTDTWIIVVAIILSTALPFVWLWRKRWLRYRSDL